MAKNKDVILPYTVTVEYDLLFTGNTSYTGSTGTFVTFSNPSKSREVLTIDLQARGTNVATIIRIHQANAVGTIKPFCRDIVVPPTTASTTEALWSRTLRFTNKHVPPGDFLKAQTVNTIAAGIAISVTMQEFDT